MIQRPRTTVRVAPEADHALVAVEHDGRGRIAVCSCGWRSRRCRTMDGPSDAWMSHLDREMPRT